MWVVHGSCDVACSVSNHAYAWGRNEFGQLGLDSGDEILVPTRTEALDGLTAVSLGDYHGIGLTGTQCGVAHSVCVA